MRDMTQAIKRDQASAGSALNMSPARPARCAARSP
jgi:hypothetical protein